MWQFSDDIKAHELGDIHTLAIVAKDGQEFELKFSALSYVNTALQDSGSSELLRNAAAALYKYYAATMDYRDAKVYNSTEGGGTDGE